MRKIVYLLAAMLLQACTATLTPKEYNFEEDQIQSFDLSGKLTIVNAQISAEKIAVYTYGPTNIFSDLKSLTDLMVRQSLAQAKIRGRVHEGSEKSIALKILSIKSEAATFHFNSKMTYEIKLGNGSSFTKSVEHTSYDVQQDINGCVADGVIDLLQDEKVKNYLAL